MGIRRPSDRMPWKETCPMEQRLKFIADWLRDEWTMTELAARYQISRKTAYKWVARYESDPATGVAERSRAPHVHGRACPEPLRARVLALRRRHPTWGPKKLLAVLQAREPTQPWPAPSTMGEW
jgi:transposase